MRSSRILHGSRSPSSVSAGLTVVRDGSSPRYPRYVSHTDIAIVKGPARRGGQHHGWAGFVAGQLAAVDTATSITSWPCECIWPSGRRPNGSTGAVRREIALGAARWTGGPCRCRRPCARRNAGGDAPDPKRHAGGVQAAAGMRSSGRRTSPASDRRMRPTGAAVRSTREIEALSGAMSTTST